MAPTTRYDAARALTLLRVGSGHADATFREGQAQAVAHVVEGQGRLLVVQKTGWGKSFVYFIATQLLREAGHGPALLISPLLSLMRNQLAAAERMGVRAATIHSDNQDEWTEVERKLQAGELDILLISPERLANERFVSEVLAHISGQLALLVIDEAHCISDWGHDFRPHYRLLERIVRTLPSSLRVLATTATANDRVLHDLSSVLGPNLHIQKGDLRRPSLCLQTLRLPGQAERLAWLAATLPQLSGSGIVYTLTPRDAEEVAGWLCSRGIDVRAYYGQSEDRPELEQALLDNRVKALVSTTALGMGFDKPDLAFVIHYQTPGSVVAYYQQVGRAGRALSAARGVLLSGKEEGAINDYFIESAFPTREEAAQVLEALAAARAGLTVFELMTRVNLSKGRIEKTLALLSLESPAPLVKQAGKWQLTAALLPESFWQRAERLTALRRREQAEMMEYVALSSGHMEFLIRALDGEPTTLAPPALPALSSEVDESLVRDAVAFLRRTSLPIEPRKMWPPGGLPRSKLSGKLPASAQAEEGRALCSLGDGGWGRLVARCRREQHFDAQLEIACAELLTKWAPEPAPRWVTCVPSLRHPLLVPEFAARLAARLSLPFLPVLVQREPRPEQRTLANSTRQARNVDGAFALWEQPIPEGAVLLVDDLVDSRWTLTVAAFLLRKAGAGAVWPLALAKTGSEA
jgi:ATP-dependent DNA helicase RecQ